jgi:hypothetical protein
MESGIILKKTKNRERDDSNAAWAGPSATRREVPPIFRSEIKGIDVTDMATSPCRNNLLHGFIVAKTVTGA